MTFSLEGLISSRAQDEHSKVPIACCIHPVRRSVYILSGQVVEEYDPSGSLLSRIVSDSVDPLMRVEISVSNRGREFLLLFSASNEIHLWDLESSSFVSYINLQGGKKSLTAVSVVTCSQMQNQCYLFYSRSGSSLVECIHLERQLDLPGSAQLAAILEPKVALDRKAVVTSLSVHPSLPLLSAGTSDGVITVYEVPFLVDSPLISESLVSMTGSSQNKASDSDEGAEDDDFSPPNKNVSSTKKLSRSPVMTGKGSNTTSSSSASVNGAHKDEDCDENPFVLFATAINPDIQTIQNKIKKVVTNSSGNHTVSSVPEVYDFVASLAFHPVLPLLAAADGRGRIVVLRCGLTSTDRLHATIACRDWTSADTVDGAPRFISSLVFGVNSPELWSCSYAPHSPTLPPIISGFSYAHVSLPPLPNPLTGPTMSILAGMGLGLISQSILPLVMPPVILYGSHWPVSSGPMIWSNSRVVSLSILSDVTAEAESKVLTDDDLLLAENAFGSGWSNRPNPSVLSVPPASSSSGVVPIGLSFSSGNRSFVRPGESLGADFPFDEGRSSYRDLDPATLDMNDTRISSTKDDLFGGDLADFAAKLLAGGDEEDTEDDVEKISEKETFATSSQNPNRLKIPYAKHPPPVLTFTPECTFFTSTIQSVVDAPPRFVWQHYLNVQSLQDTLSTIHDPKNGPGTEFQTGSDVLESGPRVIAALPSYGPGGPLEPAEILSSPSGRFLLVKLKYTSHVNPALALSRAASATLALSSGHSVSSSSAPPASQSAHSSAAALPSGVTSSKSIPYAASSSTFLTTQNVVYTGTADPLARTAAILDAERNLKVQSASVLTGATTSGEASSTNSDSLSVFGVGLSQLLMKRRNAKNKEKRDSQTPSVSSTPSPTPLVQSSLSTSSLSEQARESDWMDIYFDIANHVDPSSSGIPQVPAFLAPIVSFQSEPSMTVTQGSQSNQNINTGGSHIGSAALVGPPVDKLPQPVALVPAASRPSLLNLYCLAGPLDRPVDATTNAPLPPEPESYVNGGDVLRYCNVPDSVCVSGLFHAVDATLLTGDRLLVVSPPSLALEHLSYRSVSTFGPTTGGASGFSLPPLSPVLSTAKNLFILPLDTDWALLNAHLSALRHDVVCHLSMLREHARLLEEKQKEKDKGNARGIGHIFKMGLGPAGSSRDLKLAVSESEKSMSSVHGRGESEEKSSDQKVKREQFDVDPYSIPVRFSVHDALVNVMRTPFFSPYSEGVIVENMASTNAADNEVKSSDLPTCGNSPSLVPTSNHPFSKSSSDVANPLDSVLASSVPKSPHHDQLSQLYLPSTAQPDVSSSAPDVTSNSTPSKEKERKKFSLSSTFNPLSPGSGVTSTSVSTPSFSTSSRVLSQLGFPGSKLGGGPRGRTLDPSRNGDVLLMAVRVAGPSIGQLSPVGGPGSLLESQLLAASNPHDSDRLMLCYSNNAFGAYDVRNPYGYAIGDAYDLAVAIDGVNATPTPLASGQNQPVRNNPTSNLSSFNPLFALNVIGEGHPTADVLAPPVDPSIGGIAAGSSDLDDSSRHTNKFNLGLNLNLNLNLDTLNIFSHHQQATVNGSIPDSVLPLLARQPNEIPSSLVNHIHKALASMGTSFSQATPGHSQQVDISMSKMLAPFVLSADNARMGHLMSSSQCPMPLRPYFLLDVGETILRSEWQYPDLVDPDVSDSSILDHSAENKRWRLRSSFNGPPTYEESGKDLTDAPLNASGSFKKSLKRLFSVVPLTVASAGASGGPLLALLTSHRLLILTPLLKVLVDIPSTSLGCPANSGSGSLSNVATYGVWRAPNTAPISSTTSHNAVQSVGSDSLNPWYGSASHLRGEVLRLYQGLSSDPRAIIGKPGPVRHFNGAHSQGSVASSRLSRLAALGFGSNPIVLAAIARAQAAPIVASRPVGAPPSSFGQNLSSLSTNFSLDGSSRGCNSVSSFVWSGAALLVQTSGPLLSITPLGRVFPVASQLTAYGTHDNRLMPSSSAPLTSVGSSGPTSTGESTGSGVGGSGLGPVSAILSVQPSTGSSTASSFLVTARGSSIFAVTFGSSSGVFGPTAVRSRFFSPLPVLLPATIDAARSRPSIQVSLLENSSSSVSLNRLSSAAELTKSSFHLGHGLSEAGGRGLSTSRLPQTGSDLWTFDPIPSLLLAMAHSLSCSLSLISFRNGEGKTMGSMKKPLHGPQAMTQLRFARNKFEELDLLEQSLETLVFIGQQAIPALAVASVARDYAFLRDLTIRHTQRYAYLRQLQLLNYGSNGVPASGVLPYLHRPHEHSSLGNALLWELKVSGLYKLGRFASVGGPFGTEGPTLGAIRRQDPFLVPSTAQLSLSGNNSMNASLSSDTISYFSGIVNGLSSPPVSGTSGTNAISGGDDEDVLPSGHVLRYLDSTYQPRRPFTAEVSFCDGAGLYSDAPLAALLSAVADDPSLAAFLERISNRPPLRGFRRSTRLKESGGGASSSSRPGFPVDTFLALFGPGSTNSELYSPLPPLQSSSSQSQPSGGASSAWVDGDESGSDDDENEEFLSPGRLPSRFSAIARRLVALGRTASSHGHVRLAALAFDTAGADGELFELFVAATAAALERAAVANANSAWLVRLAARLENLEHNDSDSSYFSVEDLVRKHMPFLFDDYEEQEGDEQVNPLRVLVQRVLDGADARQPLLSFTFSELSSALGALSTRSKTLNSSLYVLAAMSRAAIADSAPEVLKKALGSSSLGDEFKSAGASVNLGAGSLPLPIPSKLNTRVPLSSIDVDVARSRAATSTSPQKELPGKDRRHRSATGHSTHSVQPEEAPIFFDSEEENDDIDEEDEEELDKSQIEFAFGDNSSKRKDFSFIESFVPPFQSVLQRSSMRWKRLAGIAQKAMDNAVVSCSTLEFTSAASTRRAGSLLPIRYGLSDGGYTFDLGLPQNLLNNDVGTLTDFCGDGWGTDSRFLNIPSTNFVHCGTNMNDDAEIQGSLWKDLITTEDGSPFEMLQHPLLAFTLSRAATETKRKLGVNLQKSLLKKRSVASKSSSSEGPSVLLPMPSATLNLLVSFRDGQISAPPVPPLQTYPGALNTLGRYLSSQPVSVFRLLQRGFAGASSEDADAAVGADGLDNSSSLETMLAMVLGTAPVDSDLHGTAQAIASGRGRLRPLGRGAEDAVVGYYRFSTSSSTNSSSGVFSVEDVVLDDNQVAYRHLLSMAGVKKSLKAFFNDSDTSSLKSVIQSEPYEFYEYTGVGSDLSTLRNPGIVVDSLSFLNRLLGPSGALAALRAVSVGAADSFFSLLTGDAPDHGSNDLSGIIGGFVEAWVSCGVGAFDAPPDPGESGKTREPRVLLLGMLVQAGILPSSKGVLSMLTQALRDVKTASAVQISSSCDSIYHQLPKRLLSRLALLAAKTIGWGFIVPAARYTVLDLGLRPFDVSNGSFTIEAWVKVGQAANPPPSLGSNGTSDDGASVGTSGDSISLRVPQVLFSRYERSKSSNEAFAQPLLQWSVLVHPDGSVQFLAFDGRRVPSYSSSGEILNTSTVLTTSEDIVNPLYSVRTAPGVVRAGVWKHVAVVVDGSSAARDNARWLAEVALLSTSGSGSTSGVEGKPVPSISVKVVVDGEQLVEGPVVAGRPLPFLQDDLYPSQEEKESSDFLHPESDFFAFSPGSVARLAEVRIWSKARSPAELGDTMHFPLDLAETKRMKFNVKISSKKAPVDKAIPPVSSTTPPTLPSQPSITIGKESSDKSSVSVEVPAVNADVIVAPGAAKPASITQPTSLLKRTGLGAPPPPAATTLRKKPLISTGGDSVQVSARSQSTTDTATTSMNATDAPVERKGPSEIPKGNDSTVLENSEEKIEDKERLPSLTNSETTDPKPLGSLKPRGLVAPPAAASTASGGKAAAMRARASAATKDNPK